MLKINGAKYKTERKNGFIVHSHDLSTGDKKERFLKAETRVAAIEKFAKMRETKFENVDKVVEFATLTALPRKVYDFLAFDVKDDYTIDEKIEQYAAYVNSDEFITELKRLIKINVKGEEVNE